MFNKNLIVLAFAISTVTVAGGISAAGLPSAASEMATEAAKQQAVDMAKEQGSALAKDQLEGQLSDHSAAHVPNAAESADAAAEEAETGETEETTDAVDSMDEATDMAKQKAMDLIK